MPPARKPDFPPGVMPSYQDDPSAIARARTAPAVLLPLPTDEAGEARAASDEARLDGMERQAGEECGRGGTDIGGHGVYSFGGNSSAVIKWGRQLTEIGAESPSALARGCIALSPCEHACFVLSYKHA